MRVNRSIAALFLLGATLAPSARAAEKLKGFYSGSGGISAEVHRVLIIEFAADGTAILQQKWHDKDPQTWHARWKQQNKKVTLIYYTAKESKDSKDAPCPNRSSSTSSTARSLPSHGTRPRSATLAHPSSLPSAAQTLKPAASQAAAI